MCYMCFKIPQEEKLGAGLDGADVVGMLPLPPLSDRHQAVLCPHGPACVRGRPWQVPQSVWSVCSARARLGDTHPKCCGLNVVCPWRACVFEAQCPGRWHGEVLPTSLGSPWSAGRAALQSFSWAPGWFLGEGCCIQSLLPAWTCDPFP